MSLFRKIKAGPCFPKVINLTHAPLVEDENVPLATAFVVHAGFPQLAC